MKQHTLSTCVRLLTCLLAAPLAGGCADASGPSGTAPALAGTWVGSYGIGDGGVSFNYTLTFFPGDSMRAVDGLDPVESPIALGQWTQSHDTVRATYSYATGGGTYSLEGVVIGSDTTITGTWGAGEATTGGGSFTVHRQ